MSFFRLMETQWGSIFFNSWVQNHVVASESEAPTKNPNNHSDTRVKSNMRDNSQFERNQPLITNSMI